MMSIAFVIELIADMNVTLFIIRDPNAEQPRYLNTAWTLQLARATVNACVLFSCAGLIATTIYHIPSLANTLRVFSLSFLIGGLQSMSFSLAIRHKQARIIMFSELASTFISTGFSVVYCYYSHDYWGIVFGLLLNKSMMTALSYNFFRQHRPKIQFDKIAAREILKFTRFVMPSSLLTLALSQFDRVVILKLFGLRELGIYGLAGNIAGSIEALISKVSQSVLYPRCAHNFRANPSTFVLTYYTENLKLFASILVLPAMVFGSAHWIISILYPSRYTEAAAVLQAFMVRAALLSLASPAEDVLIASGENQVILHGNVFRAFGLIISSLTGYYFFGFIGFAYGVALSGLPPLIYYWRLQRTKGMMIVKYELYKVGFVFGVAIISYVGSNVVWLMFRAVRLGN
jgi:O-antigen/teichoic acid export membrane protein